jgi:hypothetical protein
MNILELPPEIIYYITEFLSFSDRYHFAKTNSVIYRNIWTSIDIYSLFDLLIYSCEINFYCTLFSDNVKDWINHSFVFYLPATVAYPNGFTLGYYYQEPNLYLKVYKTFDVQLDMSQQQIEKIKEIEKLGFNHESKGSYTNSSTLISSLYSNTKSQMEFSKKIGYISDGYDFLFDELHKNIQMILQFYHAEAFFPIYMDDGSYVDIIYNDLCQLSLNKNKKYSKEDIRGTYYSNVWYETSYHYNDFENLKISNEKKQKILSEKIHQILHTLRLTTNNEEQKDKPTLRKIASYKSRKQFI